MQDPTAATAERKEEQVALAGILRLTVNGRAVSVKGPSSALRILRDLDLDPVRVAVALNGTLLPDEEVEFRLLHNGDALEVVGRLGGGGAPAPTITECA